MDKEIDLVTGWDQLLKKREAIGKKASEMIELSEEGKCSYDKGYFTQEVFLCRTCNKNELGSGVCVGCYLSCHLDHDVAELGPKANFRCDCSNPRMKNSCNFVPKNQENAENAYNQNFLGKFCVCGMEDSDDRDCEMYMCIRCYDWFHSDCIEISNNTHNHSILHEENIPGIPSESLCEYYFICYKCINVWKFIPSAYKHYIYFDKPVKRPRNEDCPLEKVDIVPEYPYHIFLKKEWAQEKCSCESCQAKYSPKEFDYAQEMEEKISLLGKINEETEKIMEDDNDDHDDIIETNNVYNEISNLPHEIQIEVANGYQILKETFNELTGSLKGEVIGLEAVEAFKNKLQEKYQAYKKTKFNDTL
jgi:hypothetical protein